MTLNRAWLLGLSLCLAILRLPTLAEPPERDLTTYAIIGQAMGEGRTLYSDLWDHKPPGIHVTFLLAQLVAGETKAAIYLLAVASAIATLIAIWRLCACVDTSLVAARWAGSFWVITSGAWLLAGNSPNTEAYVNAAFCWAMALLMAPPARQSRKTTGLVVGLLLLGASLYKHLVVIAAVPIALAHVLSSPSPESRRHALKDVVTWLVLGVAGWCILGAVLALTGSLRAGTDALLTYNAFYGGDVLANLWRNVQPDRLVRNDTLILLPLLALSALALFLGRREQSRHVLLWLSMLIGMTVVIGTHELPYAHYKLLWIPVLCVGAGWGVAAARRAGARFWLSRIVTPVATLALVAIAVPELLAYRYDGYEWSELRYNNVYAASEELADVLAKELPSSCTFYQYGSETGLYFHSHRRPPAGVTYAMPLVDGPLVDELVARTIDDLRKSRPCLIIVSSQFPLPRQLEVLLASDYKVVGNPVRIDHARTFTYYQLNGTQVPRAILAWRYAPRIPD